MTKCCSSSSQLPLLHVRRSPEVWPSVAYCCCQHFSCHCQANKLSSSIPSYLQIRTANLRTRSLTDCTRRRMTNPVVNCRRTAGEPYLTLCSSPCCCCDCDKLKPMTASRPLRSVLRYSSCGPSLLLLVGPLVAVRARIFFFDPTSSHQLKKNIRMDPWTVLLLTLLFKSQVHSLSSY